MTDFVHSPTGLEGTAMIWVMARARTLAQKVNFIVGLRCVVEWKCVGSRKENENGSEKRVWRRSWKDQSREGGKRTEVKKEKKTKMDGRRGRMAPFSFFKTTTNKSRQRGAIDQ